ncbi:hypothetical protein F5Y17DRAFT_11216 [Xylariaceae sp. FL0594]|nr:hypothetical protein F5Y17DRAFT_11216 [Xylariaceae sp. FL0594]
MGWIWSSGAAPKGNNSNSDAAGTSTIESPPPPPPPPPQAKAPEAAATYSDPEIAKFMSQVSAEFGGGTDNRPGAAAAAAPEPNPSVVASATTPPTSQPSSSSSSSWWPSLGGSSTTSPSSTLSTTTTSTSTTSPTYTNSQGEPRLDPVGESLLPTTMSCQQAFDQAVHCSSLGGQWTSVYREGSMRSCSEQWGDFWFCMRLRAYAAGPVKEEMVRDYYRQRELRRYYTPGKPASTDIWEPRAERLPPGTAFSRRYEKPDISDEEWRILQIERRRAVQRMLMEEEERELRQRRSAASSSSSSSS